MIFENKKQESTWAVSAPLISGLLWGCKTFDISRAVSWIGWRKILLKDEHTTEVPVVPHKAVAEVSRIGNYRRDRLLWVTDGRAKTLMDRTVQRCNWLTDELTDCRTD